MQRPSPISYAEPPPLEGAPLAGIICLIGVFLHLIIAGPLLDTYGISYSASDAGAFYEKLHPGSYFIFASFGILLFYGGDPLSTLLQVYKRFTPYLAMMFLLITLILYMIIRDGAGGIAFFIDTHLTSAIAAIVLSAMPTEYTRKATNIFIALALLNSFVGIGESITQDRLFHYKPDWNVIKEEIFRASALRGHPLSNTVFTSVFLFYMLSQRYSVIAKSIMLMIFLLSMIGFAGRASLVFTTCGLLVLGCYTFIRAVLNRNRSLLQSIGLFAAALGVPVAGGAILFLALNSHLGESLMARAKWDDSAASRELVLHVFDFMTPSEIIFGGPASRITEITGTMARTFHFSYIENPWLMMFMMLGAIGFFMWLVALVVFFARLMRRTPPSFKAAIIVYFLTASTFNSFGVKDSTYMLMIAAGVCAGRARYVLPPIRLRRMPPKRFNSAQRYPSPVA